MSVNWLSVALCYVKTVFVYIAFDVGNDQRAAVLLVIPRLQKSAACL